MIDSPIEALKALAHPLRFRIMEALSSGELNVGEIEAASDIGQPTLSQQLAILRKAELVTTRRDAKQVYYAIAYEPLAVVKDAIANLLPKDADTHDTATDVAKAHTGAAVFARMNI